MYYTGPSGMWQREPCMRAGITFNSSSLRWEREESLNEAALCTRRRCEIAEIAVPPGNHGDSDSQGELVLSLSKEGPTTPGRMAISVAIASDEAELFSILLSHPRRFRGSRLSGAGGRWSAPSQPCDALGWYCSPSNATNGLLPRNYLFSDNSIFQTVENQSDTSPWTPRQFRGRTMHEILVLRKVTRASSHRNRIVTCRR
jgi:hypothetical protein